MKPDHPKIILAVAVVIVLAGAIAWQQSRHPAAGAAPAAARTETSAAPAASSAAALAVPPPTAPARPAVLRASGLELPLAFEDGPLSPELRNAIIDDVNLVYAHLHQHTFLSASSPTSSSLGGRVEPVRRMVMFEGSGRFLPAEHLDEVGRLVEVAGVETMVIPRRLIDHYAAALQRKAANAEAYRKLDDFIAGANDISAHPPPDPAAWFYFENQVARDQWASRKLTPEQFARDWKYQFRAPSLLDVKVLDESLPPSMQFLRGRLTAKVYYRKPDGGLDGNSQLLVYDAARWKILMPKW